MGTWEDIIKMDLNEIKWEGADWNHLAQDRVQWRAVSNTVMRMTESLETKAGANAVSMKLRSLQDGGRVRGCGQVEATGTFLAAELRTARILGTIQDFRTNAMAPQLSLGLGLLHKIRLNFLEACQQFFLQGRVVSPTPNSHPRGPGLCIYIPQRQGGYPF
jgi:hypothetical protein